MWAPSEAGWHSKGGFHHLDGQNGCLISTTSIKKPNVTRRTALVSIMQGSAEYGEVDCCVRSGLLLVQTCCSRVKASLRASPGSHPAAMTVSSVFAFAAVSLAGVCCVINACMSPGCQRPLKGNSTPEWVLFTATCVA